MATAISGTSNAARQSELADLKHIQIEQRFANQFYAQFKSLRFGIEACCYEDLENAVINKELCDWQNSGSTRVVVSSGTVGVFVEPLAVVNIVSSAACPTIPSNVCTILDLEDILANSGTYSQCFEIASSTWIVTHNLGKFPSVTIVDSNNQIVVGDVAYTSSNVITLTFQSSFAGCVYLN
jgi:hypothetical protein|tara:strand:- start:693 stop:1235 length:543 start_codon:yes stop_codon:yes gene_type:complete